MLNTRKPLSCSTFTTTYGSVTAASTLPLLLRAAALSLGGARGLSFLPTMTHCWKRVTQGKTNFGSNACVLCGINRCRHLHKSPLSCSGKSGLLWRNFSGLLQRPCITSKSTHRPVALKTPTQKGSACSALPQTDVLPKTYVLFIVLTVFLGPGPGALPLGEHINV